MNGKTEGRLKRLELGFGCVHEFRQLRYQPKYIARDFEIRFYCIFCRKVTNPVEVNDLEVIDDTNDK